MLQIITVLMVALMVTLPVCAEVGTINFLSAGTITNSTTRTTGFSDVKIEDQEVVAIQMEFQGSQAGTGLITCTMARSKDGITFETTPRFTAIAALNGNTAVVAFTNLTALTGGAHSLRLVSVQNADASASATNCTISIVKKRVSVK